MRPIIRQRTALIPNYSEAIAYDKDGKKFKEFKAGGKSEAAKPAAGAAAPPGVVMDFAEDGNHFGNFIKAVRSRKVADLTGPIGEGHLSSALCHTPERFLPPRQTNPARRNP